MGALEELQNEGWFISEEGLKLLSDEGKVTNPKIILKKALDVDLREIAAPGFPEEVGRCKVEGIPGGLVVQLQKVRNVSAPKANEESGAAPRMLKVTLTDGHSTCHAIEIERIPQLTLNTPPGTKILLKPQSEGENIPVVNNYLLLTPQHAEVLGGRVIQMVEKWELSRSLAKHKRTTGGDGGPPPWIPFGQKIVRSNPHDKNFKSLQDKDKTIDTFNPEFEAQRKDAIAEAGRAGAKKVFGGGNRVLLDHNVQQIVDSGFTVEQAEAALKSSNNNVDRAIKSLQKNSESVKGSDNKRTDKEGTENRNREGGRGKGANREGGRGRGHGGDDDVGTGPKPSGKVSLFEFFSDKLPFDEKDKDRSQGGSGRGSDRGGRGGGAGGQRGGSSRMNRAPDREAQARVPNADRGGRGGGGGGGRGGGRGGERRQGGGGAGQDRPPRERRDPAERKGKREDNQNGRPSNAKSSGDKKPPRFANPRNQLQHESAKYVGHTPSSAVSANSSLGQGGSDWGSALAGRVGMMSLLDCESTPENEMLFGNSTWSNNIRGDEDFQPYGQHQQGPGRSRDGGRNVNLTNKGPRPYEQQNRQTTDFNNSFENGVIEGFGGGQHPMPGRPRNAFSNNFMPNIPAFPFNDNGNPVLQQIPNHGMGGRSNVRPGSNASPFDGVGGGRNPVTSDPSIGMSQSWPWQQGDKCMAKYWEDERYYNAEVTGVSDKTCVVRFVEYGNHEEVLKDDCIPITEDGISVGMNNGNPVNSMTATHPLAALNPLNRVHPASAMHVGNPSKPMMQMNSLNAVNSHIPSGSDARSVPFQGIMEFRRGGTRPYIKQAGSENVNSIGRERKPQRAQQSMYVPPAQRK